MKKIKAFIYVYYKSLTNFPYYRDVLKTKFSFSVKYFLFLAVAVSLITTIAAGIKTLPNASKKVKEVVSSVKAFYPSDLVFSIKNGEWSVNRPEPFIINMPKIDEPEQSTETPKNLIVFYNNGTIDDLKTLDTLVLVNKVNVLYQDGEKIGGYPIKNLPDSKFDKSEFDKAIKSFDVILGIMPVLFIVGTFLFVLFGSIVIRTFYFAWFGLLIWLIAKITGTDPGYKNSVKIAIHSATLPVTIGLLTGIFGLNIPIPFWFSLVNVVFATFVLINMNKAEKTQE